MRARPLTVIIVITVVIVIGTLLYLARQPAPTATPVAAPVASSAPAHRTTLRVEMRGCDRVGSRTRVWGVVRNTGDVTIAAVTVQSIWKNPAGDTLDTGLVYAVGKTNPLKPGEAIEFEDTTDLRGVTRCNVRPLDYFAADDSAP